MILTRSIKSMERTDKMKNQSVLLAKENEDGYILLGTIILMPDRSNDADKTEKKSDGKADK